MKLDTNRMFRKYSTIYFTEGDTFQFDLRFDRASNAAWSKVVVGICSFLTEEEVEIYFN